MGCIEAVANLIDARPLKGRENTKNPVVLCDNVSDPAGKLVRQLHQMLWSRFSEGHQPQALAGRGCFHAPFPADAACLPLRHLAALAAINRRDGKPAAKVDVPAPSLQEIDE
jgi:hypothetical protein